MSTPNRREPRPPFFEERGRDIATQVIIAVTVATLLGLGAIFTGVASDLLDKARDIAGGNDGSSGESPLADALVGNWRFVRYEPAEPTPSIPGVTTTLTALQFFDDGTFVAIGTTTFEDGRSIEDRGSGTYAFRDDDTIRFTGTGADAGLSELTAAINGDELKLTDPISGLILVYERV